MRIRTAIYINEKSRAFVHMLQGHSAECGKEIPKIFR